jgi:N-(2-amino-2-carboxyethyl)-L-glutamate synthase
MDLLHKLGTIAPLIGHTPMVRLNHPTRNLYAKLEYNNFSGSVKDRAAHYILLQAIRSGAVNSETLVVESSSGNFAISLAYLCKTLGLKFVAVIDANINEQYEQVLRLMSYRVIKITELDNTGGYLLNRIKTVQEICSCTLNSFWPNQYNNENNYLAYYHSLGVELAEFFDKLNYIFVGVSSGGTITGLSCRLKEAFNDVKVIAVDIEGSVIFGQQPKRRFISGIGASMVPPILKNALIDDVVVVSQEDTVSGCHQLLFNHQIFCGASTGAVYVAADRFLSEREGRRPCNAVFLCADRGYAYMNTIFRQDWLADKKLMMYSAIS